MFSQFKKPLQNQNQYLPVQQQYQFGIQSQLQYQQQKAFSQQFIPQDSQTTKKMNYDSLNTTQTMFHGSQQEFDQTHHDLEKVVNQLQQFVTSKFTEFGSQLQEHERILRPIQETSSQLNHILIQSEGMLKTLQTVLEKVDRPAQNQNYAEVQSILERMDGKLNILTKEVDELNRRNGHFSVQVMQTANKDRMENKSYLDRVLIEMQNAKKSLQKKMKK